LAIYSALTAVAAVMLFPFVNVIAVSFSDYSAYVKNPMMLWPENFNVEAFKYVATRPYFANCYFNTVFVTAASVILSLALITLTAYPLAKSNIKGKSVIMKLIIFTMLYNGGLIPNFLLIRGIGLYNSLWSLVLTSLFSGFNLILMKSFMEEIPDSLVESAKIEGAGDLTVLIRIIIPLCVPIISTLCLFVAVGQWNSFYSAVVYIRDQSKWTLQLMLREIIAKTALTSNFDSAETENIIMPETIKYASLIVVMLPVLCIYPFIQRYFVKGVMIGAVKG
jgi:putative aldouronate transport system permease protein